MTESDDNVPSEWSKVDALIRKDEQSVAPAAIPKDNPLAGIQRFAEELAKEKLDLIGRFKAGRIERSAVLNKIRAMHDTQLDATKHALKRVLEVEKDKVDLIAKKYIYEITEEHLRDMEMLGMHNYTARMNTLLKLALNKNLKRA